MEVVLLCFLRTNPHLFVRSYGCYGPSFGDASWLLGRFSLEPATDMISEHVICVSQNTRAIWNISSSLYPWTAPQQTTARKPQPRRSRGNRNHPKPKRGENQTEPTTTRSQPPEARTKPRSRQPSHQRHEWNHRTPGNEWSEQMKTNGRRNAKKTKQQAKQQAKPSSRRMSKFPQQALHINKPVLNSNDVSSLIGDDPTITRREALVRFRRNVQIRRPIRTTPANMLKLAKLTATIPDAGSRQLTVPAATTGSRGEKRTNTNRTSFRARSSPSAGRSPIDSLEVTGMETIQRRITTRRRHVTAQAPSTPSVTNHVLPITIFTMMTIWNIWMTWMILVEICCGSIQVDSCVVVIWDIMTWIIDQSLACQGRVQQFKNRKKQIRVQCAQLAALQTCIASKIPAESKCAKWVMLKLTVPPGTSVYV